MFRKMKEKENNLDITSLNHILKTGNKIVNIGYFMAIIALIVLATYLIKEWSLIKYFKELLSVISPIFIGFLIAWFFEPFVSKLQNKKVPRIIGCILVYLFILGFLFLSCYLLIPSLIQQLKDFVRVVPSIFQEIGDFCLNFINKFDSSNSIDISKIQLELQEYISSVGVEVGSELPKNLFRIGRVIISGGFNFILGLMIGFYLLFDFSKVNHMIYDYLPSNWKDDYKEITHRINTSLRSYVMGLLMVMFLVFITQCIGLTLAGMEAPILFAMFCAVTDIIPYFGPYIGAVPAIIVGFTISPFTGICCIISILVVQLLENNFYQPLIMGHTMQLHPVTIMVGLLLFEHFFGILGMVVATPCIACIKIIFNFILEKTDIFTLHFDSTENT